MRYLNERFVNTVTIDVSENTTTASSGNVPSDTNGLNGIIRGILVDVPDMNGTTPTITLTINDVDGYEVFSQASIAENDKTSIYADSNNEPLQLPVAGQVDIQVEASEAQSSDRDVEVILLVDRS